MSREIVVPAGEVISRPKRGALYIWAIAAIVGALVAFCVYFLHGLISYGQFIAYGATPGRLAPRLADIQHSAWWNLLLAPLVGGAIVCLLLRLGVSFGWNPAPRTFGLQDVVLHRRLRRSIRATTMTLRDGFLSALTAVVSLAWGGSSGREEPAAHIGATVALLHGRLLGLDLASRRLLVGMGVAAAIGASLHAPIAGVFLARELILRRQRLTSLGPVAVASAAGWLVSMWLTEGRAPIVVPAVGDVPVLAHVAALAALPMLIGVAYGCNVAWTRAPLFAARVATRLRIPLWLLPLPGGLALGAIALTFPQVLGIGYEPLASGLNGNYGADLLPILALAKIAATAVTFAFRWGGGAISPSLYIGAMLGSSLGVLAGLVLGIPAPQAFMGLVGMAVCFAVLSDSPFAATILVLELSGSTAVGATSLFCCFVACMVARRLAPLPPDETSQTLRWR